MVPFHVHTCLPTYGQPRVGNEAFRTFYNAGAPQRTWRLTHWRDPAPPASSGHRQAAALVAPLLAALAGLLGLPGAAWGQATALPTRRPQHRHGIARLQPLIRPLPSWRHCSLRWPPGATGGCLGPGYRPSGLLAASRTRDAPGTHSG